MGNWGSVHPFVPVDQAGGYQEMILSLKRFAEITGFAGTSFSQIPELRENMQD
jgi:glycine dehydrogenase